MRVGDMPLWGILVGILPAIVVKLPGMDMSWGAAFLTYLGVTAVVAILWQLDKLDDTMRSGPGESGGTDDS